MQICGLMMVRNEVDIIRINILHHLALGIDHFLIVDNGSSDGTDLVLQELSQNPCVRWTRYNGLFWQSKITTELAREAYLRGADWVVPIDADEFWYAPGGDFRTVLERSTAGAVEVEIVNFVQRRDQLQASPEALLHMTRRPPDPVWPIRRAMELVEACQVGFVEHKYVSKWISRASLALEIGIGNHYVNHSFGPQRYTDEVAILHAPLRARSILEAQIDHGKRVDEVGTFQAWHVRRWRRMADEGSLDQEWRANSYEGDCLDVYGVHHNLVFDARLRDVVAAQIDQRLPERSPRDVFSPPLDLKALRFPDQGERVTTILARMQEIEGWLDEPEARLLMATTVLALIEGEPQAVVEIGSFQGRSTVVLGTVVKAVCPETRVYAIDPHEGQVTIEGGKTDTYPPTLQMFERNIAEAGLAEVVETIQNLSYEIEWDKPISLLFIDGLHDYQNVARDFQHFDAWLVPGGYVVFDDYDAASCPGVVTCVDEIIESGRYREVQRSGRMIATQKLAPPLHIK